jgi:hypothetical protein
VCLGPSQSSSHVCQDTWSSKLFHAGISWPVLEPRRCVLTIGSLLMLLPHLDLRCFWFIIFEFCLRHCKHGPVCCLIPLLFKAYFPKQLLTAPAKSAYVWSPGWRESFPVLVISMASDRGDSSFLNASLTSWPPLPPLFPLLPLEAFPLVQQFFEAHPWPSFCSLSTVSMGSSSIYAAVAMCMLRIPKFLFPAQISSYFQ